VNDFATAKMLEEKLGGTFMATEIEQLRNEELIHH